MSNLETSYCASPKNLTCAYFISLYTKTQYLCMIITLKSVLNLIKNVAITSKVNLNDNLFIHLIIVSNRFFKI